MHWLKTFALSRAIITGCSFYLFWSHNADTNPFECLTQKGMKKAYNGGFFFVCEKSRTFCEEWGGGNDRPTRTSKNRRFWSRINFIRIAVKPRGLAFTSLFFGVIVKLLNCKPLIFKNTYLYPHSHCGERFFFASPLVIRGKRWTHFQRFHVGKVG